ncbi:hypothetical protein Tco_1430498 [Tanacetum coccineum]
MQSQHHLLLRCIESDAFSKVKVKYVSTVDDDTFPDHKICMPIPMISRFVVVGSSGGLFYSYDTIVGFGVSPRTSDPMLVRISFDTRKQVEYPTIRSQVEVVINEFIYWLAYDSIYVDGVHQYYNLIMSFNMISEELTEVYLLQSLTSRKSILFISKLRESLVVVENNPGSNVTVWILQNCDPKSFTKLFTFNTPNIGNAFVFRKSGKLLIMKKNRFKEDEPFAYESNSQQITATLQRVEQIRDEDWIGQARFSFATRFLLEVINYSVMKITCHCIPNGIEETNDRINEAYECQTLAFLQLGTDTSYSTKHLFSCQKGINITSLFDYCDLNREPVFNVWTNRLCLISRLKGQFLASFLKVNKSVINSECTKYCIVRTALR